MRWIIPMLCFFGGAMFGMLTMALMVASSRERTYHCLSSQGLPESQEECEGKEGA